MPQELAGVVEAVHVSPTHTMAKLSGPSINLLARLGVEDDAHCGVTVKHRSRVRKDPSQTNLRQVHLIHGELFDELKAKGFDVQPGQVGENITTRGIALLELPAGTLLHVGNDAVVEVTGLRNPCSQLEGVAHGLMEAVLDRDSNWALVRKAGIMGIVRNGGTVRPGDEIRVTAPAGTPRLLEVV